MVDDVAEFEEVFFLDEVGFEGMVDFAADEALFDAVGDDEVGFLEEVGIEFDFFGGVGADGGDVGAGPDVGGGEQG